MAKSRNWEKTSFIFRDSWLNAFNRLDWDAADLMKALKDYRILGFIPEDKYKPHIYSIVEQWISDLENDNEEYKIKILAKKLGAYKTNYWRYWKTKFKDDMLDEWYTIEEIKKMIKYCSR